MVNQTPCRIFQGDSLAILKNLDSNSVDSLVTDPPAGIGILNLEWDKDKGGRDEWTQWLKLIMIECHRVLKPGSHAFVWALPRTSHWTATALEDAGFRIKDVVNHIFATGFPKSMAIDKAVASAKHVNTNEVFKVTSWIRQRRNELGLTNAELDRIAGVRGGACHWTAKPPNQQPAVPTLERWKKLERILGELPESIRVLIKPAYQNGNSEHDPDERVDASKWKGWGTALKPAHEHWILAQKPITEHNLAANILKHETGALNIDACRIETDDKISTHKNLNFKDGFFFSRNCERTGSVYEPHLMGRFPTNLVLSSTDEQDLPIEIPKYGTKTPSSNPLRFFKSFEYEIKSIFCPKPNRNEKGLGNLHPTVKPVQLMKYLCRMITPSSGIVLDPFMGSGTTGVSALQEGFGFVGIEKNLEYFRMAEDRLQPVTLLAPSA